MPKNQERKIGETK